MWLILTLLLSVYFCPPIGEGNGVVTHFKNVIHARETRLGCGIAIKPGDGAYVVAHYSMGPMIQFKLNDFSPLKDIGPRKEPGKIRKKKTETKIIVVSVTPNGSNALEAKRKPIQLRYCSAGDTLWHKLLCF